MKRFLKILLRVLAGITAFIILCSVIAVLLIRSPSIQTKVVHWLSGKLADKLKTEVSIGSVDIRFFKTIVINDILILDQRKDTLLSAGKMEADIRLFDLFHNNIGLKNISLNNVNLQMIRKEGEKNFNFNFILKALASNDTTPSKPMQVKLALDHIDLNKIRFHFRDGDLDMHISLPYFQAEINKTDINKARFDVQSVVLNNPIVRVHSLHSNHSSDTSTSAGDNSFIHLNTKSFGVTSKNFELRNAQFIFDDDDVPVDSTSFNYGHMSYSNINIIAQDAAFLGDSIKGKILHFSAKEKSGLELDTLKGNVVVTPVKSAISNMVLRTPRSRITDYFDFTYYNFPAFFDFINEVHMHLNSKRSVVELRDIACLSNYFDQFKAPFTISGKLSGTIANIEGKNVEINSASLTTIKANVSILGLPDANETYFDISADNARTSYNDITTIYPSLGIPSQLKQAGTISFNGNFTGFLTDFVTYGALQSDLGLLQSDLNMKHLSTPDKAIYSGSLSSGIFNLGRFLKQDSLIGDIVFNARVSGTGLTANTISASIISSIPRFDFNGYSYSNIDINGLVEKKLFTGKLDVEDPNIRLDFQGTVDFNKEMPQYKFYATLDSVSLKSLHFSNKDYNFCTKLQFDLSGDDPDNILGSALAENISFKLGDKKIVFDSVTLRVTQSGTNRNISLSSDFIDANVEGKIDFISLYPSLLTSLSAYFPSIPTHFDKTDITESFNYDVQTRNMDKFFDFFYPAIKGFNQSKVSGSYDAATKNISLTGNIPSLNYTEYKMRNVKLSSGVTSGKLLLSVASDTLFIGDSSYITKPKVSSTVYNNAASFNIIFADKLHNSNVNLSGELKGGNDSVNLHLAASTFVIQGHSWSIDDSNSIVYGKSNKYLRISDLKLHSDNQSISVQTGKAEDGMLTILLGFNNVDIAEFYRYIRLGNYDASGTLNGSGVLINPLGLLRFNGDFSISHFVFNGDSIQNITVKADYDINNDAVAVAVNASGSKYNFKATGSYIPSDSTNQLAIKIDVLKFDLKLLDKYLSEYISSVQGQVVEGSVLNLSGTVSKPILTGKVSVADCKTTINYLQTAYSFSKADIIFKDGFIDLGEINITDKFSNKAIFGGQIYHNHLKNFDLKLFLNTAKFCALNTTRKDNNLYFGTAFVSGVVQFNGPLEKLQIDARVTSKPGTSMSIPISDQSSSDDNQTIRFINTAIHNSYRQTQGLNNNYLTLNLDLELTPDAEIKIIFDQKAGDIISGRGNGSLRLEIKTNGDFSMYGDYTIEEGLYNFTLQNLFADKKFVIGNGGTISWSGEPYKAQINIDAIYSLQRCSISNLINDPNSLTGEDKSEAYQQIPVDVYMHLSGSLLQPNVSFDIKLPDQTSGLSSIANQEILNLKQNPDELNKQVFGLLILGQFLPENAADLGSSAGSGINNSVSEFLLNQVGYWASQNKYNVGVNLNYNAYNVNGAVTDPSQVASRREVIVGLKKSFLNERVSVQAGGNFDVTGLTGGGTSVTSNNHVAADVNVQYKLTPDGRITLNAYNKSQYDVILDQNQNKRGVSIAYKKEFDNLKELFSKTNKSKPPKPDSQLPKQ